MFPEYPVSPASNPSPKKENYAKVGIMTECSIADDGDFQRCRWCPNAAGNCANLIFGAFCYCIDAQKDAR
jgi:hypothetical protein